MPMPKCSRAVTKTAETGYNKLVAGAQLAVVDRFLRAKAARQL